MDDINQRILSYHLTMAAVRKMMGDGIISESEYEEIDTIIADKYGLSSGSIFR